MRKELLAIADAEPTRARVVQLNMQLFPLSLGKTNAPKKTPQRRSRRAHREQDHDER